VAALEARPCTPQTCSVLPPFPRSSALRRVAAERLRGPACPPLPPNQTLSEDENEQSGIVCIGVRAFALGFPFERDRDNVVLSLYTNVVF
jgi:hypothetical protein